MSLGLYGWSDSLKRRRRVIFLLSVLGMNTFEVHCLFKIVA
jgi:hypothetical protein